MSVWETKIVCSYGDRSWENVYHILTDGELDVSTDALAALSNFYISRMISAYTVVRVVRRVLGTHDAFIEIPIGVIGAIAQGGGDLLPLWNTINVVLNSATGRNGLKFLRGMMMAADLTSTQDQIDATKVSQVQDSWDTFQNAVEATSGQHLVFGSADKVAFSGNVESTVGMRQRHRKRRRST
jgi:hypothetical protein